MLSASGGTKAVLQRVPSVYAPIQCITSLAWQVHDRPCLRQRAQARAVKRYSYREQLRSARGGRHNRHEAELRASTLHHASTFYCTPARFTARRQATAMRDNSCRFPSPDNTNHVLGFNPVPPNPTPIGHAELRRKRNRKSISGVPAFPAMRRSFSLSTPFSQNATMRVLSQPPASPF